MLAGTAVTLLIGLGCGDRAPKAPETPKEYPIKATVTAIDPDQKKVKLEHEEIPGLMSAMEMAFTVRDPKLLEASRWATRWKGR